MVVWNRLVAAGREGEGGEPAPQGDSLNSSQPAMADPLLGPFLVDGHVHVHPDVEVDAALDAALANAEAAARRVDVTGPALLVLLLAETSEAHVFEALANTSTRPGPWRFERTAEAESLLGLRDGHMRAVLIAGRQSRTREGLEVLALAFRGALPDDLPLEEAVDRARTEGAVVVVPWGFGKWWGTRGALLSRFLTQARPGEVFLGDNGGRPTFLPRPRLFRLGEQRGFAVLPGSDPLPLAGEGTRLARYGFRLEGQISRTRPSADLKGLLRTQRLSPPTFGSPESLDRFLVNQVRLRLPAAKLTPAGRRDGLLHDTCTPDIETASDAYARRFDGPVGAFFLDVQQEAAARLLGPPTRPLRVLELGGGHAQLTPFLLQEGHEVWVHGSAAACARRLDPLRTRYGDRLRFVTSSLFQLPFPDRSFDLVVAIRLLAHIERLDDLLAESARVTRHRLLVDFAPLASVNLLEPILFRLKRRIEGSTRPFFVHSTSTLKAHLRPHGLTRFGVRRELAWPMALHRALNRRRLSESLESVGRHLGLTHALGSPAFLLAERRTASRIAR